MPTVIYLIQYVPDKDVRNIRFRTEAGIFPRYEWNIFDIHLRMEFHCFSYMDVYPDIVHIKFNTCIILYPIESSKLLPIHEIMKAHKMSNDSIDGIF